MTWLYLVECEEMFNKLEKRPVYAVPEFKEGFEYGWRAACRFLEAPRPEEKPKFLLDAYRFKLGFDKQGRTGVFCSHAKELEGRWVALVPAEDDCHLSAFSPLDAQFKEKP